MKRFSEMLGKITDVSGRLMLYGIKLAFGVLMIGIIAYKYNQWFVGGYANEMFCIELIRAAFSLFVQFIIGGIILDCAVQNR